MKGNLLHVLMSQ